MLDGPLVAPGDKGERADQHDHENCGRRKQPPPAGAAWATLRPGGTARTQRRRDITDVGGLGRICLPEQGFDIEIVHHTSSRFT